MTALRLPSRRDLRLASGLVLFTYITLHLANHALGLVAVDFAEVALARMVAFWQSAPGTVLLYGAAAIHVALALNALYRRRTLRMPPLEMLRIALGLGIPILLIGHAVGTRIAWEAWGLAPDYRRVVWNLWTSDSEGRQLALLVPGWLHGCLGVNFAFGRRPLYQKLRPALFALALLLPVLSALGFLAMSRELASDPAQRAFLDAHNQADAATRIALARLRDGLIAGWFALIGAIFVAREVRALVERRRSTVVTIAYPQRNARVPAGWSVLEASRSHHIPHLSLCGGQARCSTCRVRVLYGDDHCPPPSPQEQATLARIHAEPAVRLACQLRPTGDIGVVPLLAAGATYARAAPAAIVEGEFAAVRVVWHNRTAFARAHLPHDVVYLSQLFADTAGAALKSHGGIVVSAAGSAVTALFGVRQRLPAACRDALAAAERADSALTALARRYATAFGADPQFGLLVHAGHGAMAEADPASGSSPIAAGNIFDVLDALADATPAEAAGVLVTGRVCAEAGIAPAPDLWQSLATPGFVVQFARVPTLAAAAPGPSAA